MKALSLYQPWASLVACGAKTIETRSWQTHHRGALAIHASQRKPEPDEFRSLTAAGGLEGATWTAPGEYAAVNAQPGHIRGTRPILPLGAVVATCRLIDCAPIGGPFDFRSGVVEGDEGDLPDRHVLVVHEQHLMRADHPRLILDAPGWASPTTRDVSDQFPFGDFSPGRWAWLLEDIHAIEPRPARGRQGIWNWCP